MVIPGNYSAFGHVLECDLTYELGSYNLNINLKAKKSASGQETHPNLTQVRIGGFQGQAVAEANLSK